MATEYALFPRSGNSIRAHSVLWQRIHAANAGYCGVSGMDPTWTSITEVSVASGTWLNKGVPEDYAGGSITAIPEASDNNHRYDLIVMDGTDSTLKRIAGTQQIPTEPTGFLNNFVPKPPELSNLKCYLIAIIRVTDEGLASTDIGSYCVDGIADVRMISPLYAAKIDTPVIANIVGMDSIGNPTDSGVAFADIARRVATPVSGNLCSMDSDGDPTDSGITATSLVSGWQS